MRSQLEWGVAAAKKPLEWSHDYVVEDQNGIDTCMNGLIGDRAVFRLKNMNWPSSTGSAVQL